MYRPMINELLVKQDPSWLDEVNWPGGKSFAACLTHDVDTVQVNSRRELIRTILLYMDEADSFSDKLKHAFGFVGLRKNPLKIDTFSPWLELENHFNFRSSFFFSASAVRKKHFRDNVYNWDSSTYYQGQRCSARELMIDLAKKGWSVGLHGSVLSASNYDFLMEQKEDIEKAVGRAVHSIRNHNLQYDVRVTPLIQDQAGFRVGSTMGFNRDIGFRTGIGYPHRLWNLREEKWHNIGECPLVIQDGALLRNDNLDLNEADAFHICKKIIDRVIATKGVVTLLWHPDVFLKPSWWGLYKRLLVYIHENNGWGASADAIYDWWSGCGLLSKLEKRLEALDLSCLVKAPQSD